MSPHADTALLHTRPRGLDQPTKAERIAARHHRAARVPRRAWFRRAIAVFPRRRPEAAAAGPG